MGLKPCFQFLGQHFEPKKKNKCYRVEAPHK